MLKNIICKCCSIVLLFLVFNNNDNNIFVVAKENDGSSTPQKPRFEGMINIKDTKYIFKVEHGQTVQDAAVSFGKEHNLEKHLVDELIGDMMEHLANNNNNMPSCRICGSDPDSLLAYSTPVIVKSKSFSSFMYIYIIHTYLSV